ncbi:MAG: ferredoxin [Lachnospiraceae bacterium]|nr:ferredoxin [Lachnospiraceae bacterium]
MEATIYKDGCISCGVCVDTCPEVFEMGEDGKAEAKNPIPADLSSKAMQARENCPVSVITLS